MSLNDKIKDRIRKTDNSLNEYKRHFYLGLFNRSILLCLVPCYIQIIQNQNLELTAGKDKFYW